MRWVHVLLALAMVAFAAVQLNDPDAPLWIAYYAVPAFWALMAAFRQRLLYRMRWLGALWACVAGWVALVVYYWPTAPGFWRVAVWMNDEPAREGMGLMIALGVLMVALFSAYRRR